MPTTKTTKRKVKRSGGDYVTAAEAGLALGISARAVARHCKAGLLRGAMLRIGWLIPRKALDNFKAPERGRPPAKKRRKAKRRREST